MTLAVCLALLLQQPAPAQVAPISWKDARTYICYRAPGEIEINGKLDDAGWEGIPWTETFLDIEGDARPRPRFRTRARMAWDDRNFYVSAELEEPHVWGTLTEHDSVIFRDNDFEVFLDPNGDNHAYDEFEMNVLNTGWDLRLDKPYRDGGPARNEREIAGIRTAVAIQGTLNDSTDTDRGWTLEIAFPFESLAEGAGIGPRPVEGDTWRVNFSRVEWQHRITDGKYEKVPDTKEDNWVWSPQGVIDMHRPEKWGYVQFTKVPVGDGRFVADPAAEARDLAHRIYHAQRAYQKEHEAWAGSIEELKLELTDAEKGMEPVVQKTGDGWSAKVKVGNGKRVEIRQDSLVTVE